MARKSSDRSPVEVDSNTGKITRLPPPRINLNSIDGVRLEMARLYRDARVGNIDTSDASRLSYILTSLAKLIETGDLEKRLDRLEGKTADEMSDDELMQIARGGK